MTNSSNSRRKFIKLSGATVTGLSLVSGSASAETRGKEELEDRLNSEEEEHGETQKVEIEEKNGNHKFQITYTFEDGETLSVMSKRIGNNRTKIKIDTKPYIYERTADAQERIENQRSKTREKMNESIRQHHDNAEKKGEGD